MSHRSYWVSGPGNIYDIIIYKRVTIEIKNEERKEQGLRASVKFFIFFLVVKLSYVYTSFVFFLPSKLHHVA
jgi:hypothetical protein